MKRLLIPLLATIALPTAIYAHPNYKSVEIKKQYGFKVLPKASKKKLTNSEQEALKALCKIGLNAEGSAWDNDDINAAIASIKWGRHWGDTAQATAYKTCNYGGYLD